MVSYAKIGGAAVVGGTLIGLTGGLAVPAVIACVGFVGTAVGVGGGLAAAMAGATGTCLASLLGWWSASVMRYCLAKYGQTIVKPTMVKPWSNLRGQTFMVKPTMVKPTID